MIKLVKNKETTSDPISIIKVYRDVLSYKIEVSRDFERGLYIIIQYGENEDGNRLIQNIELSIFGGGISGGDYIWNIKDPSHAIKDQVAFMAQNELPCENEFRSIFVKNVCKIIKDYLKNEEIIGAF